MASNSTRGKSGGQKIDLEAEINHLRTEISSIVDRLSEVAESNASQFAEKAERVTREGLENGEELSRQLQAQLAELDGKVTKVIRDNPLPAIGLAAGVGFLVAMLLRR